MQKTQIYCPAPTLSSLQPPITPASGDLTPLGSEVTCTHVPTPTQNENTHTHFFFLEESSWVPLRIKKDDSLTFEVISDQDFLGVRINVNGEWAGEVKTTE